MGFAKKLNPSYESVWSGISMIERAATFILTVELDAGSFAWLDGLRREHFPAERNFLPAHLTMFHQLTPAQVVNIHSLATPRTPIDLRFDALLFLGFGVAIRVNALPLERLRNDIKATIGGPFSRQDDGRWRPHVTIQNKVPAETARRLQQRLEPEFTERAGAATGLLVWKYLGGPWKLADQIAFPR